ncbi:MAG: hypothetical protein GXO11_03720 [Epsilonproteobacteria bacterium]|nr:hypothetical protein [Campylobacterota bacterium]
MAETHEEKVFDEFEIHLEKKLKELQACQKEKDLITCSKCEFFLECELRKEYVDAVYNSMSKGDTGGFEF